MSKAQSVALIRDVRRTLRELADPDRAAGMQKYMKSRMPFRGVKLPEVRRAARSALKTHPLESAERWRDTVLELWRQAKFREERYAACELIASRGYRRFLTLESLPMIEEMITTGAWWDLVDELSVRVGEVLETNPGQMSEILRAWARSEDMWKRRAAIICQRKRKTETDLELLYACIEPSLGSKEFFLQKAIGWALRSHAWTDSGEVVRYVRAHRERLSPLSKREALKNVGAKL